MSSSDSDSEASSVDNPLHNALDTLTDHLSSLTTAMQPLVTQPLYSTSSKLPLVDRAKLYVMSTYAIESLLFSHLRLSGVDLKREQHPILTELERVKQYVRKIQEAEQGHGGQQDGKQERQMVLDKAAAGRFIKAGLSGNEKYDAERKEREAREKARAYAKLLKLEKKVTRTGETEDLGAKGVGEGHEVEEPENDEEEGEDEDENNELEGFEEGGDDKEETRIVIEKERQTFANGRRHIFFSDVEDVARPNDEIDGKPQMEQAESEKEDEEDDGQEVSDKEPEEASLTNIPPKALHITSDSKKPPKGKKRKQSEKVVDSPGEAPTSTYQESSPEDQRKRRKGEKSKEKQKKKISKRFKSNMVEAMAVTDTEEQQEQEQAGKEDTIVDCAGAATQAQAKLQPPSQPITRPIPVVKMSKIKRTKKKEKKNISNHEEAEAVASTPPMTEQDTSARSKKKSKKEKRKEKKMIAH